MITSMVLNDEFIVLITINLEVCRKLDNLWNLENSRILGVSRNSEDSRNSNNSEKSRILENLLYSENSTT